MQYISYIRVSTQKQGKSGLGLEAQRRDIKIYMDNYAQEGDELLGEFLDIESGKVSDRENLMKAVEMCQSTGATLLVAKLDRLSRDVEQIAGFMKRLNFKVAELPHADKFNLHIRAAMSEMERDFISQRTKAALAVKKAKGFKLGAAAHKESTLPKGLKRQPKAAIEFASKFKKELEIFRSVGLTYEQISTKFNSLGHKTREGSEFSKKQVQRMCARLEIK